MSNATEPRIYVACLASYNAGKLHGAWIDNVTDAEQVREGIAAILKTSPERGAEEWAIHDHEGFAGVDIGENPDLDALATLAERLEDDSYGEAFAAWVDHTGADWDDTSGFQDAYNGEYDSERDFAEQFAEDIGAIPEGVQWPCDCIDWEHATRELMYDYFSVDAEGGGVHIFRNC